MWKRSHVSGTLQSKYNQHNLPKTPSLVEELAISSLRASNFMRATLETKSGRSLAVWPSASSRVISFHRELAVKVVNREGQSCRRASQQGLEGKAGRTVEANKRNGYLLLEVQRLTLSGGSCKRM